MSSDRELREALQDLINICNARKMWADGDYWILFGQQLERLLCRPAVSAGSEPPPLVTATMIRNARSLVGPASTNPHFDWMEWYGKQADEINKMLERAPQPPAGLTAEQAAILIELADWCHKAADGRCCKTCDRGWLYKETMLRQVAALSAQPKGTT